MDLEQTVESVYRDGCGWFTLDEVLSVFRYFFEAYRDFTGEPHPPLTREQIRRIIDKMPCLSDGTEIGPEDYPSMIDDYFMTVFEHCDYRIHHFFAGCIRDYRWFKTCY